VLCWSSLTVITTAIVNVITTITVIVIVIAIVTVIVIVTVIGIVKIHPGPLHQRIGLHHLLPTPDLQRNERSTVRGFESF
jgi:hypothetical protein